MKYQQNVMFTPEVSIVIPLYNKEKYIRRSVESILMQTYSDYEIIIVDDGSTDNSIREVKKIKDRRVRFYQKINEGPGRARNYGAELSCGKYLTFLDADDEWLPDFLEKTINVLKDGKHDIVLTSHYLGEDKTDMSAPYISKKIRTGTFLNKEVIYPLKFYMDAITFFIVGNFIIKKNVFNDIGGFFSVRKSLIGEDRFLFIKIMFACNCYALMEPLIWYHAENSQLFYGRKKYNLLPQFIYSKDLYQSLYFKRKVLKRFLSKDALNLAHIYEKNDQLIKVKYLIRKFPLMKQWPVSFFKLIIKMNIKKLNKSIGKL